jgi:hypothetical protein
MTRKELITELRAHGLTRIYGKALSRATKTEMESHYRFLETGRGLRYFSPSQMNTFLTCGLRYYYHYIEGLNIPPGWYMTLGSSVDVAVTLGYEFKIQTGRDTPEDVLTDMFVEDLKAREGETDWTENDKHATEKLGLGMLKVFADEVQPQRVPLRTQHRHLVQFQAGTGYGLYGIRDTDMDGDEVVDLKTTTRAKTADDLKDDFQLNAYGVSYMDEYGLMPDVGHDTLLRNKKGTEFGWAAARFKPSDQAVARFLKTLAMVADAVHRGVFLPPSPASMHYFRKTCSESSCGFFQHCHQTLA